ncbi:hypothetical protein FRC11_000978 [Ceratobasidium sp. 423]|nr:hypothetical protein FRC11_000978 [Ceratobasidium sp. 423]
MVSNGSGTGLFFVIALGVIGLFLMYWLWAVHQRKNQQRMLGFPPSPQNPRPRERLRHHCDPVVRMEAGENTDGLPKQLTQLPSRPPPAYDPTSSPPRARAS